jgi:uncharacterized protein
MIVASLSGALRTALAALVLAGFLSPAQGQDTREAATAAAVSTLSSTGAGPLGRGALYRVRHNRNTAWLFGTVHVGMPGFAPLGPEVYTALAQARRLVLELDVRNEAPLQVALERHGLYADGEHVAQHIAPATLARLDQTLAQRGMPLERVARMKPWLLANLLLSLDLDRHGYRRQHGAEYLLLAAAPDKPVAELESALYQMSLFDAMAPPLQEAYLRETLDALDSGQALNKARALIHAWADADRATLEKLWEESLAERSAMAEFMHTVLLDARNPAMADKIEALLREEGGSFVGVGLLHLIGDNGLPALLKRRGYTVEKVY